jgi:hypothetical protein
MTKVNLNQSAEMNQSEKLEVATVLNQTQRHPIRSPKYSVVTTGNVLEQLMEETGLTWEKVAEENNRETSGFKGFGTHLIRCTIPGFSLGQDDLNKELIPQLYIKNSYHGRTKFEMHIGLFRVFCMNGLILGNRFYTKKIKHIGLTAAEVQAEVEKVKEIFTGEIAPFILALKETKLTEEQQLEFAEAALKERVRSNENFIRGVNTKDLLTSVRVEDDGAAIWEVLQRVQDNLELNFRVNPDIEIRYEYLAEDKHKNKVIKERKVSRLKNIQEVTYMNQYLFDLAKEFLVKYK